MPLPLAVSATYCPCHLQYLTPVVPATTAFYRLAPSTCHLLPSTRCLPSAPSASLSPSHLQPSAAPATCAYSRIPPTPCQLPSLPSAFCTCNLFPAILIIITTPLLPLPLNISHQCPATFVTKSYYSCHQPCHQPPASLVLPPNQKQPATCHHDSHLPP